jgi:hypothetical protein
VNYNAKLRHVYDGNSVVEFFGDGLPKHANSVWVPGEYESQSVEQIVRFLHMAYEAGRQAKAKEIREVLGVKP